MICSGASTDAGEHGLLKSLEHSNSNVDWSNENELHLSREIHSRARNTEDRSERLKLYTRMRQMCVMPALITNQSQPGNGSSIDVELYNLPVERYKNALSHQSKINRLVDVVMRELSVDPTRKSLIFCHFRREMLQIRDVIRTRWLTSSSGDCDIDIIDGSVSGGRRNRILAASPQILILQIRTCSEGLNLQAYSDVYFVSPNWNPCVEDQAIARCYRMGQTSQVRVFRFYMTDFVGGGGGSDGGDSGDGGHGGSVVNAGEIGDEESITTLDNKCEATQERKRILCREFLDQERVSCL
jgi:SNF2 family DNA or RNA helicase